MHANAAFLQGLGLHVQGHTYWQQQRWQVQSTQPIQPRRIHWQYQEHNWCRVCVPHYSGAGLSGSPPTRTNTQSRSHARTHARTRARTHARRFLPALPCGKIARDAVAIRVRMQLDNVDFFAATATGSLTCVEAESSSSILQITGSEACMAAWASAEVARKLLPPVNAVHADNAVCSGGGSTAELALCRPSV